MLLRFLALAPFLLALPATAKDLEGRWGAGLTVHDFHQIPALSLRYVPERHLTATAVVGFDTNPLTGAMLVGGKIAQNAVLEENLNFYLGLGGFLLLERDPGGNTVSGFELDALLGAEFFLSGLPNLGFQFETGMAYRSAQTTAFRTLGNGFLGAGIHYYF